MERDERGLVPLDQEVLVLEGEMVASIRALAARGLGSKRIAATRPRRTRQSPQRRARH
jgi:hypothetical protein